MPTMYNQEDIDNIISYFHLLGYEPIIEKNIISTTLLLLKTKGRRVVVSDCKWVRGLSKIFRCKSAKTSKVLKNAEQHNAIADALLFLNKKSVPVYFYNRVGLVKKGFEYSRTAERRMRLGLSFPKMYEDIKSNEDDLREIYGDKFSYEYIQELGKIPQILYKGVVCCHEDYKSKYVNVINGKRITCFQPSSYEKTIHVYGRCGAFGYAVEDADTLPSQLQKLLVKQGINNIRVVNHGLWGADDLTLDGNFLQDALNFDSKDIVLFYRKHYDNNFMAQLTQRGMWYLDTTPLWHKHNLAKSSFFDKPGHMSASGYGVVAEIICRDLLAHSFSCGNVLEEVSVKPVKYLTSYLKKYSNDGNIENEVKEFTDGLIAKNPEIVAYKNNGAIVMNCNPFTKGHRYLIEYASKKVDILCIFVVEEDKSFFKFEDRLVMVKSGVRDLDNVVVVPSGQFIISTLTFPEYFMKDYVKEKSFDVSGDIQLFCRYIAPALNIKTRFVGEEPFDPVTLNYNESMSKILPEYGMALSVIPRLQINDDVVTATRVRNLLQNKQYEKLRELVPETTYNVLMDRYKN